MQQFYRGFDLTCKGEQRLSKNRRAVNCGAKERGERERERKREREREGERALSYSLGREEERMKGPDLYVQRKPQCLSRDLLLRPRTKKKWYVRRVYPVGGGGGGNGRTGQMVCFD